MCTTKTSSVKMSVQAFFLLGALQCAKHRHLKRNPIVLNSTCSAFPANRGIYSTGDANVQQNALGTHHADPNPRHNGVSQ